jgi:hypothetical protein
MVKLARPARRRTELCTGRTREDTGSIVAIVVALMVSFYFPSKLQLIPLETEHRKIQDLVTIQQHQVL